MCGNWTVVWMTAPYAETLNVKLSVVVVAVPVRRKRHSLCFACMKPNVNFNVGSAFSYWNAKYYAFNFHIFFSYFSSFFILNSVSILRFHVVFSCSKTYFLCFCTMHMLKWWIHSSPLEWLKFSLISLILLFFTSHIPNRYEMKNVHKNMCNHSLSFFFKFSIWCH